MKQSLSFAKKLRQHLTDTERFLWRHLRDRQLGGFKFRRQGPIGKFVVDFVCLERRVVVELDGGHHTTQECEDHQREQWLTKEGYRVLRFWNHEVFEKTRAVLETILKACQDHPPSASLPSREGEDT